MFPESKVTEIYCMADDFCKEFTLQQEKYMIKDMKTMHRNKPNRMSDAEIMVILILFHSGGFRCFKHYYKEYVCKHLKHLFPRQVSYNRFVELEKEVLLPMTIFIKKVLLGICTGISFVDSTPLCVCRNQRILIHKTFEGLAERGRCSMGWFFGFKLHLIINDKGEILNFMFTPGNVDDREPLKQGRFLENIKGKLCADKGYIGQALFENLFLNGIQLVTKVKNNMRNSLMSIADKILLRKRALIETVNDELKNIDKGIFPQAFCKIIPDILGGDPEYCNIMHADGAGTKSSLAYMYWKETGDLSVWKGIAQDALIMNIDDLLCVGAVDNILVSSTIGRNKLLVPGEVISAIINGTDELLAELREMGVGVYATGGETADVGDLVRTIIVDSTVTCRMKRSDVIDNANIRPGDVIIGLSSCGQATYEKEYNGGMGSNGLTSARHDVFAKYLAEKYPESYDKAVPDELVYSGKLKLTDSVEGSPLDAGKLVLSPTRTYAPVVKKLLDALRPEIHGMVHCSGGAQTKVLHFVGDNCRVVKDNLFPVPP